MKTITNYIKWLLFSFLIVLSSCSDNINLEPEGIITKGYFFLTASDYEKALNSVYIRLNDGTHLQWVDGTSDDALVTHSWNQGYDLGRAIGTTFSSFPLNRWKEGYNSVQRANNIISNIDVFAWSGGDKNPDRNRILAEARCLRAYFYLNLVAYFGNIQFYTTNPANIQVSSEVTQVEPKMVFDFVLKELDESISSLPDKPANKSKFGKSAARLLRARAAAYTAGYLKDKKYFDIVLDETTELMKTLPKLTDYSALFTYGNESIDEVLMVRTYSPDGKNSWGNWYNNSIGGYCVTTPVKALVDAYEYLAPPVAYQPYTNKDPRFSATIYAPGAIIRGKYYNTIPNNTIVKDGKLFFDPAKDYGNLQDREVLHGDVLGEEGGGEWNKTPTGFSFKKYNSESETWNTYNYYIMFRYAEAILLRAEALVETGGSETEAKQLIQKIRDRAGNTNDVDEMISKKYGTLLNLIRNERRVELAQEGLRLFDIRRWGQFVSLMSTPVEGISFRKTITNTKAIKDTTYSLLKERKFKERDNWWPIPQSEIDLNKGRIKQNEGWVSGS